MLDLSALRAAALQTRRSTSDNGYRDDREDGEIFDYTGPSNHGQRNRTTNVMSNSATQDNTLSRSYQPQSSISTFIPHTSNNISDTEIKESARRSPSQHSEKSPMLGDVSDDNGVESELVNLSDMGIEPEAFINFGLPEDAIISFCKKYGLPLPSFAKRLAERLQNPSDIQRGTRIQEPYNSGASSSHLSSPQSQLNSPYVGDVVSSTPQPLPKTGYHQGDSSLDLESDMEISDSSDQEQGQVLASDSDVEEDMDIEDSIGTSTIIMTSSRVSSGEHWADPESHSSSTETIQTHQELQTDNSLHGAIDLDKQSSDSKAKKQSHHATTKLTKQAKAKRKSLIEPRHFNLSLDVSSDSEVMTELAQELFMPVLPELRSQQQSNKLKDRESEAATAAVAAATGTTTMTPKTNTLTARFKQIADMKKMIEQMEQSKKKDKASASDGESPPPTGVNSVIAQPPTTSAQTTAANDTLNLDIQETTAELVARAQVVVDSADAEQLSALKATDDTNVNQLLKSLERNDRSSTEGGEGELSAGIVNENASTPLTNDNVVMASTPSNDIQESTGLDSPFTEYEAQLKSLQQIVDDQDEALLAIEAKIEEMRKQQESLLMQKEQARTKALGVRAKLSMLQRASASPKVQSPITASSTATPTPQTTTLPAKRPSPYVEENGTTGEIWQGMTSRTSDRRQSKRGKFDRPVAEVIPNPDIEAAKLVTNEIIDYPRNDTHPLFNEIRDRLAKIISTEGLRVKEKSVHVTDNRHDHIRLVKKPQDFLEYFVEPATPQAETLDTPSSNQPDISANLKDHGRPHDTNDFKPYQSPLQRFRSFQYFGGPSNKSMAYSNPVDTSKNMCTFELAGGTCNDDTCRSRHFRDFDLTTTDVMQDLLTYSRGENEGLQLKYQKTMERMFATLDAARTKKPISYVRAALDIRRRNLSGNQLQKVSLIPSPARRQETIKRKLGGSSSIKPVAQKLPITSALQSILVTASTIELRYFEVDERNYPTDPKNVSGWIRAVVQSLPSSQFTDYDKTNSKSLDLNPAINVLRQALARNPTSDILWCLYVELWMYRGDEKMFEREMEQAVRNVPYCLDLMWCNVLLASSVEDQIAASDNLLRYFNNEQAIKSMDDVSRSITLLEILCRQAAILISNDRQLAAKKLLAGVLSSTSVVRTAMKLRDQVLLAACYFHVCAYERVPTLVFRQHFAKHYQSNQGYVVPLFIVVWNEALAASSFQDISCVISFERQLEASLADASDADHILFLTVITNLLEFLKRYPQAISDITFIKKGLKTSHVLPSCTEL